ncbi:hypothetical protein CJO80_27200 (plasmid) [Ralstonia solanacearum]|nr:hypothetical protein CJO80_27200 [Ralstonia solanacearum]
MEMFTQLRNQVWQSAIGLHLVLVELPRDILWRFEDVVHVYRCDAMYAPCPNQPARTRPVIHIPVAGDDAGREKPAAINAIAPSHPAKFNFTFMVVVLSSGAVLTVRAQNGC